MSLPDPRNHPPVNSRNPLIRQLMSVMTSSDSATAESGRSELRAMLSDLLAANDHAAINAALTQAPDQQAWQALWQALREVVESGGEVTLFALPVIIVAGSAAGTTLPGRLADPQGVLRLLRENGLLAGQAEAILAPQLVSAESMAAISPCQVNQWKNSLADALNCCDPDPFGLAEDPVSVKEESAWLRFLVGAVRQPGNAGEQIRLGGQVGRWGLALSELLGQQLKAGDATVLAIPRAPQGWLSAQETGRTVLLETRLQLLASSAIRTIRSKRRTPVAVIAAHDSDEIRITFSSREDGERWQGFVWPLAPADHVEYIADFARSLFQDCQVEDVRIIDSIQPDRDGELPFFVTAHFAPVVHH